MSRTWFGYAVAALTIFGFAILNAPAQTPAAAPAAPAVSAPAAGGPAVQAPPKEKTFYEVLKAGGVIMIPIVIVSIVMVGLVILSFLTLTRSKLVPSEAVHQLRQHFSSGDYVGALQYCQNKPGFFTNVVGAGVLVLGHGREVTEQAMGDALAKEASMVNTRNYYLNLIGVVTPMLGLTGTVLGMIKAFSTLGESGIGDPSKLAGAIGEVLVATASGLFIAVPGFSFYYVFRNWIIEGTAYAEDHINLLFRNVPYAELDGQIFGESLLAASLNQSAPAAPAAAPGQPEEK